MAKFFVYPFAVNGQKQPIDNEPQVGGVMSYNQGFTQNYELELGEDPNALPIPRDKTNQFYFDVTENIRQYQTEGLPRWVTPAENDPGGVPTPLAYEIYARVRHNDGSGIKVYENQLDGNTSEPSVGNNTWAVISAFSGVPAGTIIEFAGINVPDGYLLCDGSLVLRADYPNLYAAIGDLYGSNDGSTNFRLPQHAGRVVVGSGRPIVNGATPILGGNVADVGGQDVVVLTEEQLAEHNHELPFRAVGGSLNPAQQHSFIISGLPYSFSTQESGEDAAHNNVQASIVELKCIKY